MELLKRKEISIVYNVPRAGLTSFPCIVHLFACLPSCPRTFHNVTPRDEVPAERWLSIVCWRHGRAASLHFSCAVPAYPSLLLSQPLVLLLSSGLHSPVSNKYLSHGRSRQTTGVSSLPPYQQLPALNETLCQLYLFHEHPES